MAVAPGTDAETQEAASEFVGICCAHSEESAAGAAPVAAAPGQHSARGARRPRRRRRARGSTVPVAVAPANNIGQVVIVGPAAPTPTVGGGRRPGQGGAGANEVGASGSREPTPLVLARAIGVADDLQLWPVRCALAAVDHRWRRTGAWAPGATLAALALALLAEGSQGDGAEEEARRQQLWRDALDLLVWCCAEEANPKDARAMQGAFAEAFAGPIPSGVKSRLHNARWQMFGEPNVGVDGRRPRPRRRPPKGRRIPAEEPLEREFCK